MGRTDEIETEKVKTKEQFEEELAEHIWNCILYGKTEIEVPGGSVLIDYTQPPGSATIEGQLDPNTIGGQSCNPNRS